MGSFSIWHWLIVLVIVLLVFGTKKLKNLGSDLGGAVKGFKDGLKDGATDTPAPPAQQVTAELFDELFELTVSPGCVRLFASGRDTPSDPPPPPPCKLAARYGLNGLDPTKYFDPLDSLLSMIWSASSTSTRVGAFVEPDVS